MREETKILVCGCKIGRSKGGVWFYDYLCEIHVAKVYDDNGKYSPEKAEELTKRLNETMKLSKKPDYELSETEERALAEVMFAGEKGVPIMELSHQLQGAIGKLISKGFVEKFRKQHKWQVESFGRKRWVCKMTNWVRIK